MTPSEIATTEIRALEVFANPFDVRRDLHSFLSYVRERGVKRSHRGNELPKADVQRLLKGLSDAGAAKKVEVSRREGWVEAVDELALNLGFVSYDVEGRYVGYSSSEPSFPDNYIEVKTDIYTRFLARSLQEQEEAILAALIKQGSNSDSDNEFFTGSALGILDAFDMRGCATGVVPSLDFARIRRFLLGTLTACRPGVWYETASLVHQLKRDNRYFLIPEKPSYKYPSDREQGRYGNFHESNKDAWSNDIPIAEKEPDAFERVEGRYVERFLEGIPLALGYVEVAYGKPSAKIRYPSLGSLKAFKVSETFLRVMKKEIRDPKITVQPDFSVHVDSQIHPASVLEKLAPLCDVVAIDKVSVLKLDKRKVAARLVQDQALDVIRLLAGLSATPLPQNVRAELAEWAGHADAFTLYEGFGLWEGAADLPETKPFVVREIAPGGKHPLRIVRSPSAVFERLETAGLVPLFAKHPGPGASFAHLPEGAATLFRTREKRAAEPKKTRESVTLSRKTTVTLFFPSKALLEECRRAMIQAGCPIEAEPALMTIAYAADHGKAAEAGLALLKKDYKIHVRDIES